MDLGLSDIRTFKSGEMVIAGRPLVVSTASRPSILGSYEVFQVRDRNNVYFVECVRVWTTSRR